MGLQINSNIPMLGAQRQANRANNLLAQTLQQLASGRRINRAADDAAGLAIAEGFNAQARQGRMEINTLQQGINYAQTAEGGLGIQQQATQRLRELAVQASNGTLTDDQRGALNAEAQQLIEQVGDVAENTEYNEQNLLGQDTAVALGTEGTAGVTITESTPGSLGLDTVDLGTAEGAAAAIETIDTALTQIGENRSNIGAQVNRLGTAIAQREVGVENALASESLIRDADLARLATERSRNQLLLQTGLAAIIQGNVAPQAALRLLGG